MALAKNNISFKKKAVKESRIPALGAKNLVFAHEATGGESFIDFYALSTPSIWSAAGFTNPSPTQIAEANIFTFRENLQVSSTLKPNILPTEYRITGNGITFLNFVAQPNEVFFFRISDVLTTGTVIADARPIYFEYDLPAGQTTVFVGDTWEVGRDPQAVMVFVDGSLVYRNTNNSSVTLDKDYYEVPSGGSGLSNTIELNSSTGATRKIIVASTQGYVEKPNLSILQSLESLAGQVDKMIPDLALLASEPQSKYQDAPNSIDLLSFNDRVYSNKAHVGLVVGTTTGFQYTSIQNAINAANDGDKITVAKGTYTENLTITKKVFIEGVGNDTVIDGTVSFNAGSSKSLVKFLKFGDNVTVANGETGLIITDCWIAAAKTVTDNNPTPNDSLYLLVEEV